MILQPRPLAHGLLGACPMACTPPPRMSNRNVAPMTQRPFTRPAAWLPLVLLLSPSLAPWPPHTVLSVPSAQLASRPPLPTQSTKPINIPRPGGLDWDSTCARQYRQLQGRPSLPRLCMAAPLAAPGGNPTLSWFTGTPAPPEPALGADADNLDKAAQGMCLRRAERNACT